MKHLIDIDTWERKENYLFFRDFHNSWIAMTSEVDCTEAYAEAKAQGRSFFLYYLYAILRAANEIKEFRYRWDKHGQVVYHDTVDITTPIAVPGKTFYTVRIPGTVISRLSTRKPGASSLLSRRTETRTAPTRRLRRRAILTSSCSVPRPSCTLLPSLTRSMPRAIRWTIR